MDAGTYEENQVLIWGSKLVPNNLDAGTYDQISSVKVTAATAISLVDKSGIPISTCKTFHDLKFEILYFRKENSYFKDTLHAWHRDLTKTDRYLEAHLMLLLMIQYPTYKFI